MHTYRDVYIHIYILTYIQCYFPGQKAPSVLVPGAGLSRLSYEIALKGYVTVAVRCRVLPCVAVCCSVLPFVAVGCTVLPCGTVFCSVLMRDAVC